MKGGFLPCDVELLSLVGLEGCLDSTNVMVARCPTIMHYVKDKTGDSSSITTSKLQQQVQDLHKGEIRGRQGLIFPFFGDTPRLE